MWLTDLEIELRREKIRRNKSRRKRRAAAGKEEKEDEDGMNCNSQPILTLSQRKRMMRKGMASEHMYNYSANIQFIYLQHV